MKNLSNVTAIFDQLVEDPENGVLANECLERLFAAPVPDIVLKLLANSDDRVAAVGAWLASELGERCAPIYADVVGVLSHPAERVRFWLIDCVVVCGVGRRRADLAKIALLLEDSSRIVRWQAMTALACASADQVQGSMEWFVRELPNSPHIEGLRQLLEDDVAQVPRLIESQDPLLRKYGAVAAARAGDRHPDLIDWLHDSLDSEVRDFSRDY